MERWANSETSESRWTCAFSLTYPHLRMILKDLTMAQSAESERCCTRLCRQTIVYDGASDSSTLDLSLTLLRQYTRALQDMLMQSSRLAARCRKVWAVYLLHTLTSHVSVD